MRFGVSGFGFRVWGFGFRVSGLGFGVYEGIASRARIATGAAVYAASFASYSQSDTMQDVAAGCIVWGWRFGARGAL